VNHTRELWTYEGELLLVSYAGKILVPLDISWPALRNLPIFKSVNSMADPDHFKVTD
jgi:hypothetical protein